MTTALAKRNTSRRIPLSVSLFGDSLHQRRNWLLRGQRSTSPPDMTSFGIHAKLEQGHILSTTTLRSTRYANAASRSLGAVCDKEQSSCSQSANSLLKSFQSASICKAGTIQGHPPNHPGISVWGELPSWVDIGHSTGPRCESTEERSMCGGNFKRNVCGRAPPPPKPERPLVRRVLEKPRDCWGPGLATKRYVREEELAAERSHLSEVKSDQGGSGER